MRYLAIGPLTALQEYSPPYLVRRLIHFELMLDCSPTPLIGDDNGSMQTLRRVGRNWRESLQAVPGCIVLTDADPSDQRRPRKRGGTQLPRIYPTNGA